ncbi:MAG: hypothetical protein ACLQVY_08485 [Limisphaerales bacterium]
MNHRAFTQTVRTILGNTIPLAAAILLFTAPPRAAAQSDNFDSGTLSPAWTVFEAIPQSYTFPTVGTGKGLEIQVLPIPSASLPAVAGIVQSNEYTDFYMAVDLVNWVVENQAAVLCARFTPGGDFGLDQGQGMIFNYDAAQAGDNPGNAYGGQLQINIVSPGFSTTTLADCDMTLVPGHGYRLVFKCVAQTYTGQLYDLNDLTMPVATIQVTDPNSTFTSGVCGFISYSRNSDVGTTDVTIDNYLAAATDPNLATPPALMASVPGTPVVETRLPAGRWQNFYNAAAGISFTAATYTSDVINSSATRLVLNGLDVSSQLTLSPNGTVITGSLPGSALRSNALYSAQISLADTTGLKTSVNTFWFDTFTDAYLSGGLAKTIECEDYNYSNGVFQFDPIAVSGLPTNGGPQIHGEGVGYYDSDDLVWLTMGTSGVDYLTARTTPNGGWDDYRPNDPVMTGEGIRQEIQDDLHPDTIPPWDPVNNPYTRPNDNTRQQYAAAGLVDYLVINTHAGDWLNYTRSFTSSSSNHFALLRVGSYSSTTITLSQVTSDPTQPSQTVSGLGTFNVPNQIRQSNFGYVPLLDTNGLCAIVNLSGTNTLRLTMGGTAGDGSYNSVMALNYLLLVPAQVTVQSSPVVAGPYADDSTAAVNVHTRTVTIPATGVSKFYRLAAIAPVNIASISLTGGTVTITY